MIFFDQNDYFTQRERTRELENSEQNIEFLKTEIATMSEDLNDLKTDPKVLERHARERYYEKKADEDVFIIVNDTIFSPKQ